MDTHIIDPNAITIIETLRSHSYQAYLVGGCVRDLLLNRIPKDYDITTNARPDYVSHLFIPLCTVVPTGIEYGTVTLVFGKSQYEVTTFRRDNPQGDGRHPRNVHFASALSVDLSRRDFTINAMALQYNGPVADPMWRLIDRFHGQEDLRNGIIRTVGNPARRFREDYLRIMRAYRFALRYHFTIEARTLEAILADVDLIRYHVSMPRIVQELRQILSSDIEADDWDRVWPLFGGLFPKLKQNDDIRAACKRTSDPSWYQHFPDLDRFLLRFSLLLYGAQPDTPLSADPTPAEILMQASLPKQQTNIIAHLAVYGGMPWPEQDADYRLLVHKYGIKLCYHALAMQVVLHNEPYFDSILNRLRKAEQDPLTHMTYQKLAVNGIDLQQQLGIKPGPQLGAMLQEAMLMVIRKQLPNDKATLLHYLKFADYPLCGDASYLP